MNRILVFLLLIGAVNGIASAITVSITEPVVAENQSAVTPLRALSISVAIAAGGIVQSVVQKSGRGFSEVAVVHASADSVVFFTTSQTPLRPGVNHVEFLVNNCHGQYPRTWVKILLTAVVTGTKSDESTCRWTTTPIMP